jgi:hypothetical protein
VLLRQRGLEPLAQRLYRAPQRLGLLEADVLLLLLQRDEHQQERLLPLPQASVLSCRSNTQALRSQQQQQRLLVLRPEFCRKKRLLKFVGWLC